MRPEWFAIPEKYLDSSCSTPPPLPPMPIEEMWKDDEYWFPLLFSKKYFVGRADFTEVFEGVGRDKFQLQRWWFGSRED